jgi:TPP-dependent pyruvate/acetoin dehydrogenase alpha subunit
VKLIEQERRQKADEVKRKREEAKEAVTDAVEKAADKYYVAEETMFEGNGLG